MCDTWRVTTTEVRFLLLCLSGCELRWSTSNSPHVAWIHILDDDSLISIFYLYRPPVFDGDESDQVRAFGGKGWRRERWWHRLAQVCQRWRNILLGSASYLGLCLVCTCGTPVADMLAHSPSLPLVIDYGDEDRYFATAEEERMIIPALRQRDRVRRVRLRMPVPVMEKLIMTIDDEYPMLEYLILESQTEYGLYSTLASVLPESLKTPRLRHLLLLGVVPPIRSQLLTTAVGLVTLCLYMQQPTAYFQPDILLRCLSFMPRLEILLISTTFFHLPDHVERQLLDTPIMTRVTLPNLRSFQFEGSGTYMKVVVHQITAPRLEKLNIQLGNESTLSLPHLLPVRFMNTAENLKFDSAAFEFSLCQVVVRLYLREEAEVYVLSMTALHFVQTRNVQLSLVAQIFNSLGQILSTVEHLSLDHTAFSYVHDGPEVGPTEWRELLLLFRFVKTLSVHDHLVKEVSRCLELDDRELELLPELQELRYSGSDNSDAFTSFVDARQNAGRSVTLNGLSRGVFRDYPTR